MGRAPHYRPKMAEVGSTKGGEGQPNNLKQGSVGREAWGLTKSDVVQRGIVCRIEADQALDEHDAQYILWLLVEDGDSTMTPRTNVQEQFSIKNGRTVQHIYMFDLRREKVSEERKSAISNGQARATEWTNVHP